MLKNPAYSGIFLSGKLWFLSKIMLLLLTCYKKSDEEVLFINFGCIVWHQYN